LVKNRDFAQNAPGTDFESKIACFRQWTKLMGRQIMQTGDMHTVDIHDGKRRGIGLFSYYQTKYSTPIGQFAVLLGGTVLFAMGISRFFIVLRLRATEIAAYGRSEAHVWGFVYAAANILFGVFMAHTGAIYYGKKLWAFMRSLAQHPHKHRHIRL
jgi:hypothetical protein